MYAQETARKADEKESRGLKAGLGFGASNACLLATYALLYWYGAQLIDKGEITFEELLISMMTLMLGAYGLGQALTDLGDQKQALKIAKKIFDLIDQSGDPKHNAIDAFSKTGLVPTGADEISFQGAIEFKNVRFYYPTRPSMMVCENLNLLIQPGEIVALVGPSGCGKVRMMVADDGFVFLSDLLLLLISLVDNYESSIEILQSSSRTSID
jgi:ATP-binding cassette subfamily B (MDR/TAP) protein 1